MPTATDDLALLLAVVPDATPEEQAAFLDLPESARNVTLGLVARRAKSYIDAEVVLREKVSKAMGYLTTAVVAEQELRDLIAQHFREDADRQERFKAHFARLDHDSMWDLLAKCPGLTETLWYVEADTDCCESRCRFRKG